MAPRYTAPSPSQLGSGRPFRRSRSTTTAGTTRRRTTSRTDVARRVSTSTPRRGSDRPRGDGAGAESRWDPTAWGEEPADVDGRQGRPGGGVRRGTPAARAPSREEG